MTKVTRSVQLRGAYSWLDLGAVPHVWLAWAALAAWHGMAWHDNYSFVLGPDTQYVFASNIKGNPEKVGDTILSEKGDQYRTTVPDARAVASPEHRDAWSIAMRRQTSVAANGAMSTRH